MNIRIEELKDIRELQRIKDFFLSYEDRHRYDMFPSFFDTIKMLDKEIRKKKLEYFKNYGERIK